ncbi:hypothetical protein niasHT_012951 [Heterodera trifolii]|uniref:RING-type domain-containing protein n=1 Tax=Heterodera trifolii TaxID=157864 RepID=A0ABD2L7A1_9BILA
MYLIFLLLLPILWSTNVGCHGQKVPKYYADEMDNMPKHSDKVTKHSDKMPAKLAERRDLTLFEKYGKRILGTEHKSKWKFIEEISKKHCVLEAVFYPQNSEGYNCLDEKDELNIFKNNWIEINQNDPALSQLMEALFATVISANKALEYDDANKLSTRLNELKQSLAYAVFFMAKRGQIPLESQREEKEKEPKEMLIGLIDIYNEWQLDADKTIKSCAKCGKKGKEKNWQKGKEKYGQKERRFLQFVAHSLEIKWDGNAFSTGGQQQEEDDDDVTGLFMIVMVGSFCILLIILFGTQMRIRIRQQLQIPAVLAAYHAMPQKLFMAIDQQRDDCAICLDPIPLETFVRPLSCNHFFHNECIEKWFKSRHKTCPICRREMATHNGPEQHNNGTAIGPNWWMD